MPRNIGILFVLLVSFLLNPGSEALAEKRVALVIGNSAYKSVSPLPNPVKDSAAVAEMFKKTNFDVVESRQDLGVNDLKRALREFADMVRDADIAVVFYAGHGIEVDGTNYLIPVDAVLNRDTDVEDETVPLDRIVRILEPAKRLRLVILDACRDNPFAKTMKRTLGTRSVGRGLAKVEPTSSDTLIAFAAKAGSTASDGDGSNSPFTTALLKNIVTPGLDLRIAFGRVRDEVLKSTGNKQEPFVYGSLGGMTVALVSNAPRPSNQNANMRRDYDAAERVGTKEAWESFLAIYKSGFYVNLARSQLAKLNAGGGQVAANGAAGTNGASRSAPSGGAGAQQAPGRAPSTATASIMPLDGTYAGQVCYGEAPNAPARCFQTSVSVDGGKMNRRWTSTDTGYVTILSGEVAPSGDVKIEIRGHYPDGRPGATINFAGKIQDNRLDATGSFANGRPATLNWIRR